MVSTITINSGLMQNSLTCLIAPNQREKGHLRAVHSLQVPKHILLTMGEEPAKHGLFPILLSPCFPEERTEKMWMGRGAESLIH